LDVALPDVAGAGRRANWFMVSGAIVNARPFYWPGATATPQSEAWRAG
jgi:hypothetical protein